MKQFLCMWMILGMLCPAVRADEPDAPDNAALRYWQGFAAMPDQDLSKRISSWPDLLSVPMDDSMKGLLDKAAYSLQCLHGGAAIEECDWGLNYAEGPELLMPHLGKARDLARYAMLRARLRFENGEMTGGIEDMMAVLKLSRDAGIDPIMINTLVQFAIDNAAIDVLGRYLQKMDADAQKYLADRLDKLPPSDSMDKTWQTESTYFVQWFGDRIAAIPAESDEQFKAAVLKMPIFDEAAQQRFREVGIPARTEMLAEVAAVREYLRDVEKLNGLTPEQQTEGLAKLDAKYKSNRLHQMVSPSSGKAFDMRSRWLLRRTMLRTAVAIAIEGKDALKKPQYADPFEKKPFQYSESADGFVLNATPLADGKEISVVVGKQ